MIQRETFEHTSQLASMAVLADKTIKPQEGTPLHSLVNTMHNLELQTCATTDAEAVTVVSLDDCIEEGVRESRYLESCSDNLANETCFDEIVKLAVDSTRSHFDVAKNTVIPVIEVISEEVIRIISERPDAAATFKVRVIDLPHPMRDASFKSTIMRSAGNTSIVTGDSLGLGERTKDQLAELMSSGSKTYDEAVAMWVSTLDAGFIQHVWDNAFRTAAAAKPAVAKTFNELINDIETGVDAALVIYLMTTRMHDNPTEDCKVSLTNYNSSLLDMKDVCALRMVHAYDEFDRNTSAAALVLGYTTLNNEVRVFGPVYRSYLVDGGKNEAIFGALVSNETPRYLLAMKDKEQSYLDAWGRHESTFMIAQQNKRFATFLDALAISFTRSLVDRKPIEIEFAPNHTDHEVKVQELFKEQVNLLPPQAMDDVYTTVMRLVCRSRFYYTSAETIIEAVSAAKAATTGDNFEQAEISARASYIADWIADQMVLA